MDGVGSQTLADEQGAKRQGDISRSLTYPRSPSTHRQYIFIFNLLKKKIFVIFPTKRLKSEEKYEFQGRWVVIPLQVSPPPPSPSQKMPLKAGERFMKVKLTMTNNVCRY